MPGGENALMTTNQQRPYRSYLLRLWQVYADGQHTWRASLESAQTGEVRHFANLQELVTYMAQQTQAAADHQEMEVLKQLLQDW